MYTVGNMDELLAKRLLVASGVIKSVSHASEGELIAELTPEEKAQYETLLSEAQEVKNLQKLVKEYQIKLNTKTIVHDARVNMWWNNLQKSHDITHEKALSGLHYNPAKGELRTGVVIQEPTEVRTAKG